MGTFTQAESSSFSISPSALENSLAIEFRMPPVTAPAAAFVAPWLTEQTGPATTQTDESDGHHTPPHRTKPTGEDTICWLGESDPLAWSTSCQSLPSQATVSVLTW